MLKYSWDSIYTTPLPWCNRFDKILSSFMDELYIRADRIIFR